MNANPNIPGAIEALLDAAQKAIPVEFMEKIGAKDIRIVSARTIKFTINPTPAGINQIKITQQPNGEWRLRTYRVEEVEDVPCIVPGSLQNAIKTLAGMEVQS